MAVQNGHFELAVALVDAGADPNDRRTGFTALHAVTWVRKPDASDTGDPPPIGSGRLTSLQFVRALVERGRERQRASGRRARPKAPNTATLLETDGATPFLMAADRADVRLMRVLLELGADPLLPNADNTTPLMAAAGLGTADPLEEAGTEAEALEAVQTAARAWRGHQRRGQQRRHGHARRGVRQLPGDCAAAGGPRRRARHLETARHAGRTPLFIAEGYKAGRPQPSKPTIDVLRRLMVAAGVPTDGARPRIIDIYERVPEPPKDPPKP